MSEIEAVNQELYADNDLSQDAGAHGNYDFQVDEELNKAEELDEKEQRQLENEILFYA